MWLSIIVRDQALSIVADDGRHWIIVVGFVAHSGVSDVDDE